MITVIPDKTVIVILDKKDVAKLHFSGNPSKLAVYRI